MEEAPRYRLVLPGDRIPYPVQVDVFETMLRGFGEKANVMIEAPTGSGKTMAMLGAVREWITTRPSGKIYLCSRTLQQLDQMVAVAKAFIGDAAHISRLVGKDRVCLLEREVHSGNVPQLCSQHRASSTCRFYRNWKEQHGPETRLPDVRDIKDLVESCAANDICPYYVNEQYYVARSKIVLAPYNYLIDPFELGVFFTHKVSAKEHVVSKRHVFVRRISHSLKGDKEFYMNYSACQNEELLKAVGSVVYESTKILKKNVGETKAGVLCFFPSYKLLQTCRDVWRKVPLWAKLVKVVGGHLFLEDSENSDLLFDRYKTALIDGEPGTVALFLVVHRGKMSEGVDFSDSLARLVVSVGLPYPSYHSPDVKVKVEFNRSRGGDGDEWYKTQAMRAVNQSVGRCVRHVNDWGAVLLLDSRYFRPDVWSDLSHWVQVCEDESSTFKDTKKSLLELNSFLNGLL
ncbi:regulator of telomere elongation helicase 1 homolog [Ixodes scapularis]|uniref:regulator of telomere elongation helicase 1 homolog n=1 Tax=Ixodes scapularis TaxID=6945 RepID=UPI001C3943CC|nr:regulator of telomere elongation helicase 1 homolog [Ixodes scapularis]